MKNLTLLIIIFIINIRCHKDLANDSRIDDSYTEQQITVLDEKVSLIVHKDNIILPDGEVLGSYLQKVEPDFYDKYFHRSFQTLDKEKIYDYTGLSAIETLKRFQSLLMGACLFLCDDSSHKFAGNGNDEPKQEHGIGYGWNLKDYNDAKKPDDNCTYKIHGLDCSGFVFQTLALANISYITGRAKDQAVPTTYENSIRKIEGFKKAKVIKVEDNPNPEKFKSGDLIYWYKSSSGTINHIGIIGQLGMGGLALFQSNGAENQCEKNLLANRGPRAISVNNPNYFGTNWGILKIIPDLSGKWKIRQLSASCGQLDQIPPSIFSFNKENDWNYTSKQRVSNIDYEVNIKVNPNTGLAKITYYSSNGIKSGIIEAEDIDLTSGRSFFTLNKIQSNPADEFCSSYSVEVEHID